MAKVTLNVVKSRCRDAEGRRYWRIRGPDPMLPNRRVTIGCGRWTDAEARQLAVEAQARVTLGQSPSSDSRRPSTVAELISAYLAEMADRHGAEHTYVVNETKRLVNVAAHLGRLRAELVTQAELEKYAVRRSQEVSRLGRTAAKSSIREECAALGRAYKLMRQEGMIDCDRPPGPHMKSVPDNARPQRRLTDAEVAALIEAAGRVEFERCWRIPRPGTKSRRIYDVVNDLPGLGTEDLRARIDAPHVLDIATTLAQRGVIRRDGPTHQRRWFPVPKPVPVGLSTLVTVLAWSGRRPVAVFSARRQHCRRLLDEGLVRDERLMFWARDKAGVGRGWGPVAEPAFRSLIARAGEFEESAELLWTTPRGLTWTAELFAGRFAQIVRAAGLDDVQPYDLRRFAVTKILSACGGQTAVARAYTGHRTDQALLRYAYAPREVAESLASSIGWTRPVLGVVEGGG